MLITLRKKKSFFIAIVGVILIGFICFGLYFGFLPSTLSLEKQVAKYNTVYVEGFSWEKMGKVRKGMTPQEVLQIMGQPAGGMPEKPFCPSWSYHKWGTWDTLPPFAEDVWWQTAQVCFNIETNTVSYPNVQNVFFN